MSDLNYVRWIQDNKITLFCENKEKILYLKKMGAKRKLFNWNEWTITYKNEQELIYILQLLNDNNFMFAGGTNGWSPTDIFILMREKQLLSGNLIEIVWRGKDKISTRIL